MVFKELRLLLPWTNKKLINLLKDLFSCLVDNINVTHTHKQYILNLIIIFMKIYIHPGTFKFIINFMSNNTLNAEKTIRNASTLKILHEEYQGPVSI